MKKIGLVLAGGGGRGAYQIGVWKALRKAGLERYITSVSGSSVGGLNAALFIQNNLELAENIWKSLCMKKILTPKFESEHGFQRVSFFERDGLGKIIDDSLDMSCFEQSRYHCWLTCVRTEKPGKNTEEVRRTTPLGEKVTYKYVDRHIEYFNLKYADDDKTRKQIILATSAMPFVFPQEEIEGYKYLDGGAGLFHGDNVPVKPLYEVDKCEVILIVHLTTMDKPVRREEFPKAILYEIFPEGNLGRQADADGMFDFTAEGAKKRIEMGYEENYPLFLRIKNNIDSEQELRRILSDTLEKERIYNDIKKRLQCEAVRLMEEYERTEDGKRFMRTTALAENDKEYLDKDFEEALDEMLAEYTEDDLVQLLCECEMILRTNDIYLKKLDAHGAEKIFNIIFRIESKCKRRIRDNYQLLHGITIRIEKKILTRLTDLTRLISELSKRQQEDSIFMQYCVKFLLQKVNDHKNYIGEMKIDQELMKWDQYMIEKNYNSYTDTKKVLQIVSDIYAITGGNCEFETIYLESAIRRLGLSDIKISPDDFAREVLQDISCLPLYIKDEADYGTAQSECSEYGRIIYRIYDLTTDQNIIDLIDLTEAKNENEKMETLCLPVVRKVMVSEGSKQALVICQELLEDMRKIHRRAEQEYRHIQEELKAKQKDEEEKRIELEKERERQEQREIDERKRNTILLFSPSNILTCSLDGYTEDSFSPTSDYGMEKEARDFVKSRIADFSPAIIVKPDGVENKDLDISSHEAHIMSLADFYFCLWYRGQEREGKTRYIAFIDYYEHESYVSCYIVDNTGEIRKGKPFMIKYNKAKKTIRDAIIKEKFFSDISENEIILYRIFESEKYINVKLEKMEVSFIGKIWRDLLGSREERKEVIGSLYDFESKVLR